MRLQLKKKKKSNAKMNVFGLLPVVPQLPPKTDVTCVESWGIIVLFESFGRLLML
jgi:hypothetical protein